MTRVVRSAPQYQGISRRVLRGATYDPGHWTFYFCTRGFDFVVSVLVRLMLAVLPYARGRGFDSRSEHSTCIWELHTNDSMWSYQILRFNVKMIPHKQCCVKIHERKIILCIWNAFQVLDYVRTTIDTSTCIHFLSPSGQHGQNCHLQILKSIQMLYIGFCYKSYIKNRKTFIGKKLFWRKLFSNICWYYKKHGEESYRIFSPKHF
jgi:hypothetical protein